MTKSIFVIVGIPQKYVLSYKSVSMTKLLFFIITLCYALDVSAQTITGSGSGFAIGNGYVVTNYHVVEESNYFKIYGIMGDINTGYEAQVITYDKNNDLAILKITDRSFKGYGVVPYSIKMSTQAKASDVFALGYPFVTTMGVEAKYNKVIISSLTGFQVDVSNYQVDVPLQPGNSGGPLFNSKGELVGIVVARHKGADNVGYAVKSSCLKTLAESKNISLPSNNTLSSLSRTQQVSKIEQFTYLILCGTSGSEYNSNSSSYSSGSSTSGTSSSSYSSGPQTYTVNGVSFKMVRVEGGTFRMGSNDSDAHDDEKPVHSVTLSSYSIGQTEVTQELWQAVMGYNPSYFSKGGKYPVENVSWYDIQEFIRRLNSLTGKNFRLPTEAEWEFAARGGNKSRGYKYAGSNNADFVAWYSVNSTHQVAQKSSNELGLYDMSGNVWELCSDRYGSYNSYSQTNPRGAISGSYLVKRGGSTGYLASGCTSTIRGRAGFDKTGMSWDVGFRLAL